VQEDDAPQRCTIRDPPDAPGTQCGQAAFPAKAQADALSFAGRSIGQLAGQSVPLRHCQEAPGRAASSHSASASALHHTLRLYRPKRFIVCYYTRLDRQSQERGFYCIIGLTRDPKHPLNGGLSASLTVHMPIARLAAAQATP
jgi:hypothetical protein